MAADDLDDRQFGRYCPFFLSRLQTQSDIQADVRACPLAISPGKAQAEAHEAPANKFMLNDSNR